ncbi:MAG: hypothetical protein ACR2JB_02230 [Bryobacteraceae bacterium]
MNLDERLEALTHTVALQAQMRIDDERKYEDRFHRIIGCDREAGTNRRIA